MVYKAKKYATEKHHLMGQEYDGAPYTKHLEMVVSVAKKYINYIDLSHRADVIAACWCHDLIEDTTVTMEQLSKQTNENVAEIVFAVSNEPSITRAERNWKTFSKIGKNELGIFVKLCDRIANSTNSKIHAPKIYTKYENDFPTLKYCLQKRKGTYKKMWRELEILYN
jgi:(p)ppGpp synthase/HD superfamily hydrolase